MNAKDKCQTKEHIESTKDLNTFQLETCNEQKPCRKLTFDLQIYAWPHLTLNDLVQLHPVNTK